MSTETVLVSEVIAAPKERLYTAWLDSDEHSAFIADVAAVEPFVGGSHSSFGGYATGKVLALEPNQKIVQSWRASDFPDGAPDSRLEVTFEETVGGTLITVLHTGLPAGQSDRYRDGWLRHYFAPMKTYFASDENEDDEIVDRTTETNGESDSHGESESESDTEELSVSASQIESATGLGDDDESGGGGDDDDDDDAEPVVAIAKPAGAKAAAKRRPVKKAAKAAARSKPAKKKSSKIARPAARTKAAAKRRAKATPKGKPKAKAKAKAKAKTAAPAKKPAKKSKKSRR
jgi:uncharacterized protein YndB with AHSA1/START domain